jgi:pyruvate dehydrogenase E1 component alpha subunit
VRYETWLRSRGEGDAFFAETAAEAEDFASDMRKRTLELGVPSTDRIFDHVYSESHPVMDTQKQWLADYEASLGAEG